MLTAKNASKKKHLRKNYLIDKLKKLLPLYWCATFVVFFGGSVFPQFFSTMKFSVENLLYSLFLVPDNTFYIYPGWTLTYFFLFYLIYFISDKFCQKRDLCASITILLLVCVGAICKWALGDNIVTSYFNPIMLEFVYGIGLFYLLKVVHIKSKYRWITYILSFVLFFDYDRYLWPRYFLPALLSCVAIACFVNADIRKDSRICSFFEKVGDISFIIYILHLLIIRPIDKILLKITGPCFNLFYFIGIIFGVVFCIGVCWVLNPLLKKMRLV